MVLDKKKSNFGNQQCLRFHIWFIMILYYKMLQTLLQNATVILSQNATNFCFKMCQVFYHKIRYYKVRRCYYKMQQLLQNTSILLQKKSTAITKCVDTVRDNISLFDICR